MKTNTQITLALTVLSLALLSALSAQDKAPKDWPTDPSQLRLDVALNQPVMLADQKNTAYLRVGLKGFALKDVEQRAPINIAVVIDKSGSMSGEKIKKAREAAIMALKRLNSRDIVSVITYDSTVNVLIPATKFSDRERIFRKIRNVNAGGNTALFAGVSKGAAEIRKFLNEEYVNRIVLLSDGLANVGPSSPAALGDLGGSLVKESISVTTIGLGTGYNEDLMTKLAYKSDGNHYFAEEAAELAHVFDKEFGSALSVVAQEVRTEIKCAPGIRPVRLLGRQGEISGQSAVVFINQIYSEHEKFIMLEIEVPPTEKGQTRKVASVSVRYDNLKTHTGDKLSSSIEAKFSNSQALVEERTNGRVMVDVVELIAIERNKMALRLRDEGKVEEARKTLIDNTRYLGENASRFKSKKLEAYSQHNYTDSQNLDEEGWSRQRKSMREQQFQRTQQQIQN